MYERRYYYISEKKSIFDYLVGDFTCMSHYKETFFKAGIPACRSKRVNIHVLPEQTRPWEQMRNSKNIDTNRVCSTEVLSQV